MHVTELPAIWTWASMTAVQLQHESAIFEGFVRGGTYAAAELVCGSRAAIPVRHPRGETNLSGGLRR